jgi:hypothetical protein
MDCRRRQAAPELFELLVYSAALYLTVVGRPWSFVLFGRPAVLQESCPRYDAPKLQIPPSPTDSSFASVAPSDRLGWSQMSRAREELHDSSFLGTQSQGDAEVVSPRSGGQRGGISQNTKHTISNFCNDVLEIS